MGGLGHDPPTHRLTFVKHDLKGVLKYIGVKICTHPPGAPPTDRDRNY